MSSFRMLVEGFSLRWVWVLMLMTRFRDVLRYLEEDEAVRLPLLKIWDLENEDSKSGAPNCGQQKSRSITNHIQFVALLHLMLH
jgi:hypothetical protein